MQMTAPLTLSTKLQTLWPNHQRNYELKLYLDKCYLILSGAGNVKIKLDDFTITNSKKEKLIGIIFDDRVKFQYHIENLGKKASLKLSHSPTKKILFNIFFQRQFSYCPLFWMCHSKILNSKINRLHERCLRLIYNDKNSTFFMIF